MKLSHVVSITSLLSETVAQATLFKQELENESNIETYSLHSNPMQSAPHITPERGLKVNKAFTHNGTAKHHVQLYCADPDSYDTSEYGPIEDWNMSQMTSLTSIMGGCSGSSVDCNPDITRWDTSKVVHFSYSFHMCKKFNQPISHWDVSSGKNFDNMFSHTHFTQDLSCWPDIAKNDHHFCQHANCYHNNADHECGVDPNAGAGGDPHFHTFGGIYFSWQGWCDSILIKTPNLIGTDPEISVHIRTKRVRKWSAIDAVAIKVGKDVAEIGSRNGKLFVNKREVTSMESEALYVVQSIPMAEKHTIVYEFDFGRTKKLQVKANTRTNMLYTTFSGDYPRGTVGLLGSRHKQGLFSRDGTEIAQKDLNTFVESWQVNDSDPNLFQERRAPQFPNKCQYYEPAGKLSTGSRRLRENKEISNEQAITACESHNPGPMKQFCIEDIISTGDIESAQDSFYG